MKEYILTIIIAISAFWLGGFAKYDLKSTDEKLEFIVQEQEAIKKQLISEGRYRCCIKDPCTYCFEKHVGEEIVCDCLDEIMQGEAPCGECIGEWLEGEGNPYIDKELMIKAVAEEIGEERARAAIN